MSDTEQRRPGRPAHPRARREVLAAAGAVFAEHGYEAASLSQIAERLGLRKASLYHHFRTKADLYVAVLDELVTDLGQIVVDMGPEAGGFEQQLDRVNSLVLDYLASHPDAARLLMREMVAGGTYLGHRGEAVRFTLGAVARFLEAGMAAGVFVRRDPRQLALSLVGVHLFYFAAPGTVRLLLEEEVRAPELLELHRCELLDQLRHLCLIEPPDRRRGAT